jgi:serine/threonine protein kinase
MATKGEILGTRYRVVRLLGGGGMKEVYLAEDLRLGNRLCAVAEMIDSFRGQARAEAIQAFEREARILAALSNEHLPPVYDFFSDSNRHYLVMEFLPGQTLESKIQQMGRLPFGDVISVGLQIAETLEYLHSQNPPVIYRDLKPSNLILSDDGRVKVVDFGIAWIFQPAATATKIGTQGYAPPEQYRGKADQRADIYALAATMHYALTGRDPANEPPFSFPQLTALRPETPTQLSQLIEEGLEYQADRRVQSASAFKNRLAALSSRTLGSSDRSQKPISFANEVTAKLGELDSPAGKRRALGFALASMFLIGLFLVIAIWPSTPNAPSEYRPKESSEGSDGTGPSPESSPAEVASAASTADPVAQLRKATREHPRDVGAWVALGTTLAYRASSNEASYLDALDAYGRALALDPNNADALKGMGELHYDRREYRDAISYLTKYLAKHDEAELHLHLGDSFYRVNQFSRAVRELKAAIDAGDSSCYAYELLGNSYSKTDDLVRGRAALKQAESVAPDDETRNWIQSRLAEVEKRLEQAETSRENSAGDSSNAEETPNNEQQHRSFFTIGSTKRTVLAIQGTPTSVSKFSWAEIWYYGLGCSVEFDPPSGKVTQYSNSCGQLHVKLFNP